MSRSHDVVVVGAGPAGSAAACALARRGAQVLLVDRAAFPRDKVCGDLLSPRALRALERMGALDRVAARGRRAARVLIVAPNHRASLAAVPAAGGALVVRRRELDALLLERACEAGARFEVGSVAGLVIDGGRTRGVRLQGGRVARAAWVVLATGAAAALPAEAGLVAARPRWLVAARRYVRTSRATDGELQVYLDAVPLPGYAWVFPTSDGTLNVGAGFAPSYGRSPRVALDALIAGHARLGPALAHAQPEGPARGHPLRVDYLGSRVAAPGIVAVGEAAGLVNPVTGEGIDYAMESGEIAAQALTTGSAATADGRYARDLAARFRGLFVDLGLAARLYYNVPVLDRMVGRARPRSRLVETLVAIGFGIEPPRRLFSPRTILDIVRS